MSSTIKEALLNCFNKLQPKNSKLTNISSLSTPSSKLPLCISTSGTIVAESLGSFLPLSGGTMTGAIKFNGVTSAVNPTSDGTFLKISGGSSSGGSLTLYGNSYSSAPGKFILATSNGSSLVGDASDSSLTWNGSFIEADAITNTSDRNLKENISEVSFNLSSLKAYRYNFKHDERKITHVGLIAQEVQEIIPEAVSKNSSGNLMLDYNAVVAALVVEVNKLKKEIAELKK